jgi:hypothetical protein
VEGNDGEKGEAHLVLSPMVGASLPLSASLPFTTFLYADFIATFVPVETAPDEPDALALAEAVGAGEEAEEEEEEEEEEGAAEAAEEEELEVEGPSESAAAFSRRSLRAAALALIWTTPAQPFELPQ